MDYIKQKLSLVPGAPGCYQMKNKDGVIIYVGKAKNLKNRLSSYFRGTHIGKTARLVSEITDFEYVVVSSEKESLILENNLIKKYDPKYNILLRDDKSYPYIEFTNEEIPRLKIVRRLTRKTKNKLYGPYPNVIAARKTVDLINRIYPLRKCETMGKKLCLYYHIGECLGYCEKNIDQNIIDNMKHEIVSFLNGDYTLITKKLEQQMYEQSEKLNYEKAKELKDLKDYIEVTIQKQKVEINEMKDIDVFGYFVDKGYLSIQIFFIRGGKIVERHSKILPLIDEEKEELMNYIINVYEKNFLLPKEIIVPNIIDTNLLSSYLNIDVVIPIKGEKKKLVDMASNNAAIMLENEFEMLERDDNRTYEANQQLKSILKMDKLNRIELFDNSHLFGNYSVSGMVVFIDGKKAKNEYRKFKIKVDTNDEYAMMREVLYRRYFRVLKDNLERPDLIIVDGGIGQINIAKEIIDSLNLNINIVGLKKNDKHTTNALITLENEELEIDKKSNLFFLLERMQDEVHNYTINYHKQIRSKGSLESVLEQVEGLGPKRRKELLKKYHSLSKIKEANNDDLMKILPKNVVIDLKEYLEGMNND